MTPSVYLAQPMTGRRWVDVVEWAARMGSRLRRHGISVLDPSSGLEPFEDSDVATEELATKAAAMGGHWYEAVTGAAWLHHRCLGMVRRADAVVFLDETWSGAPSIGVCVELGVAIERRLPLFAVRRDRVGVVAHHPLVYPHLVYEGAEKEVARAVASYFGSGVEP